MIEWWVVALAFLAGLLLVGLLEAVLRADRTRGQWLVFVSACICLLVGGWLFFTAAPDELVVEELVVGDEIVEGETAVSPLPPPSIFTFSTTIIKPEIAPTHQAPQPAILAIPDLDIQQKIVDVPLQDGTWSVADLGEDVGLLAGTGQHPGDNLAMVLAGHMTFPSARNLLQGAFANLQYAIYGTEVIMQMDGEEFLYEVVEIKRVDPSDVEKLRVYDGDSILLVTCTDWDENGRFYASRLLIRAERVDDEL